MAGIKKQILGLKWRIVVLSLLRSIAYEVLRDSVSKAEKLKSAKRVSVELVDELNQLEKIRQEENKSI